MCIRDRSYAVRLAGFFDLELWNAGLSGYIFDEKLLDRDLPFSPDIVTVAFGTVSYTHLDVYKRQVQG